MTRLIIAIVSTLLVSTGCGDVVSNTPDGAIDPTADAPPALPPGAFLWQQPLFTSFATVALDAEERPVLSASMSSAFDIGGGVLTSNGTSDILGARFTPDGVHEVSWSYGSATGNEFTTGLSVDPVGNSTTAGVFFDQANLGGMDIGPAPANVLNSFVVRYGPTGAHRWSLGLTSPGTAFVRNVSTNGSSYAAMAGEFSGELTIGSTTLQHTGGKDIFFVRLNQDGAVATARRFATPANEVGLAAMFDNLGNVILVGTFEGQLTMGETVLDAGPGRDLFVARLTVQGEPQWATSIGGSMDIAELAYAAVGVNGEVVVAGQFTGDIGFQNGGQVSSVGGDDIFLAKLANDGGALWIRSFGGPGNDAPRAVTVGRSGDIAMTGEFLATASFGGDPFTSQGFLDIFVARYSADGEHIWSRAMGSAADDRGGSVAVDSQGAVYLTAAFHNTVDFGGEPLTSSVEDWNSALVKYAP